MTLKLYYTSSDNEVVAKSLSSIRDLNDVHPFDETSIEEPILRIGSLQLSLLNGCNYAYIPEFGRYYYVGKPTLARDGIYKIKLTVDVLMSFADSIRNLQAIIDKEESSNNLYINDGTFVHGVKDYTRVYNYSVGFNDTPDNILICAGGQ